MEAEAAETRAQKAARIRPELFRLLLDFDPPEEERTEAERLLMQAKEALQRQIQAEQELVAAEAERQRIEDARIALYIHDRRRLSPGFRGTCRTTRDGGGLPEGRGIPPGITHDLVLLIDLPARRMEREERLLATNDGDVNATLIDICREGGGNAARFLLAHGADANYTRKRGWWPVLSKAASRGHLAVVEALLDAGADDLGQALVSAALGGHNAVVALLLDHGAEIHHQDDRALHYAAFNGHLDTSTLLLHRGATATNGILAAALRNGHHEVADLLRAHGAV
jgi:Ankyrin repeats (many copies)